MSYTYIVQEYSSSEVQITRTGDDFRRRYSTGWRSSQGPEKPLQLKQLKDTKYDKVKAKCLSDGTLFKDPDFDAVDSVLFIHPHNKPYAWERPKKIVGCGKTAEFFIDGASRFDVKQGKLGDCWALAAMSCLSMHTNLMRKVVPAGHSFEDGKYAGIFRFNLWSFGEWVEVIIDDRLPVTIDDSLQKDDIKLAYVSSSERNEFWTALLEKAYAKLYGSYTAINGGLMIEAMEDFTGGIGETYVPLGPEAPSNLWSIMTKARRMGSLICAGIFRDPTGEMPSKGLFPQHAYSVTSALLVNNQQYNDLKLVRVRNPWGSKHEWKGDWSDNSPAWKQITESEKQRIGLVFEHDGEFWMSFEEFLENFQRLDICHLDPNSFIGEAVSPDEKRWTMTCLEGCWKRGVNAGGAIYSSTAWINPQYGFEVVDVDESDNKNTGTVVIALMQKDRRKKRLDNLTIGYAIYKLKNPASAPLDKSFDFKDVHKPLKFSQDREICGRHELSPGSYCVIPFAEPANQEADFILRFFAEKPVNSKELDEPTGIIRDLRVKPASEVLKKGKEMWEAFKKSSGEYREMDAYELRDILNAESRKEFKFVGFTSETCRSLVALKDVDRSGKLGNSEFIELWILLHRWETTFKKYDQDGNGTFDSFELRLAFHDIGYSVSNQTFNALVRAYSSKDGKIYFDDFIHCLARLSQRFEVYNEMHQGREDSNALFNLDQFVQTTMYA